MEIFVLIVNLAYAGFPSEQRRTEFRSMQECLAARQKTLADLEDGQKIARENSELMKRGVAEVPTTYSATCVNRAR